MQPTGLPPWLSHTHCECLQLSEDTFAEKGQCLCQTYPAEKYNDWLVCQSSKHELELQPLSEPYAYYPLLVGVNPLLQICFFAHQLCKVAFKALSAYRVSRKFCR